VIQLLRSSPFYHLGPSRIASDLVRSPLRRVETDLTKQEQLVIWAVEVFRQAE
jgi:hypothetical protein